LRVASVAQSRWPSVVGFDNLHEAEKTVLTSMRVPWEDLGRAAAHTLFLRKMGTLTGPPVERIIPLKLIPRLSSRQHNEGVREYLPQRIASGQGLEAKVY
jgi:DNA-binding LacI/PurR family transcriptional regulator